MSNPKAPRTVVEFMDHPSSTLAHKTLEVWVNGTPVLIERDGVDIEFKRSADGTPLATTVVTLRLLPTEVHFTRPHPEGDALGNHIKE